MKTKILVLLSLIFLIVSCKKENENKNVLVGKWDWVSSVRGLAGETLTPSSTGIKMIYQFSNTTLIIYVNDSLANQSNYTISVQYKGTPQQISVLSYVPYHPSQSFSVENDSLFINDLFADGYTSTFVKEKN
ncbi:MAG: hypothetical protein J0H55_06040 [Chitinophagaceae bacterium]|nr:hypothetical protein [Chitinophagaceae bacterium]